MTLIVPDNEMKRLEALLRFHILDTEEDEVYNHITKLAASIMETPIALISFVDQDRVWLKSKIGISVNETPREYSFCTHTILSNDPTLIEDASTDIRFCNNPYVVGDPKIRFYYAVPLLTSNQEAVGSICAIDNVSRKKPTSFQVESIKILAKLVMTQLELREFIINIHNDFEKLKSHIDENDRLINAYQSLNSKCESILDKIKARKNR